MAPVYSKPIAMLPAQLAVDVDRVLLHLRRLLVLIDEVDLRRRRRPARPSELPDRLAHAAREGIGERDRRAELVLFGREGLLAEADLAVVGRRRRLIVPRRPVDAVAGAQHRLAG